MKHLIRTLLIGLLATLSISTISCDKDDEPNNSNKKDSTSALDSILSVKSKIREKVTYRGDDHSEKFKERWSYDKSRRDTLYELFEDGSIIERNLNYKYTAENGVYTQNYTRKLYLIGYQTAYLTENVTKTYVDSAMNKLKEEVHIGKKDSSRISYRYNDAGLCESISTYENGELKRQTGNYAYNNKRCTYIEKYQSLNSWYTRTCEVEYANVYYTLVTCLSVFKGTSNDEADLYERTLYEYNSFGQKTKEEYYNGKSLGYALTDFQYEGNKVTYKSKNYAEDEDFTIIEILLDI
ncbi:MAG: hypothetical protein MJZ33_00150 [Paludibacteraceae bacterium]|nr:hypothetical protein [Paludibacteraceae bacterium]